MVSLPVFENYTKKNSKNFEIFSNFFRHSPLKHQVKFSRQKSITRNDACKQMPTISHDLLVLKNSHKTAINRHHYTVSVKRNCTLKNMLKKITVILIIK